MRPLVLVVDTPTTYRHVSAMLSNRNYAVALTTASGAVTILTTAPMKVAAVVTNEAGPFAGVEHVPLIVTGFTGPDDRTSNQSNLTIRLTKPLKRSDLLAALGFPGRSGQRRTSRRTSCI